MEFIVPLVIAAGIAYLYISFKKSKKDSAPDHPEAPYKVEAPVAAVVKTQITDAVTTPAKVKLRQPGTPKKAPAAKKPAVKKTPATKKPSTKKATAKKPAPKAS